MKYIRVPVVWMAQSARRRPKVQQMENHPLSAHRWCIGPLFGPHSAQQHTRSSMFRFGMQRRTSSCQTYIVLSYFRPYGRKSRYEKSNLTHHFASARYFDSIKEYLFLDKSAKHQTRVFVVVRSQKKHGFATLRHFQSAHSQCATTRRILTKKNTLVGERTHFT